MKLRLPWKKPPPAASPATGDPAACPHPRIEVEMHGTVVTRRWCAICGEELAIPKRPGGG